jgi:hypothetical protein
VKDIFLTASIALLLATPSGRAGGSPGGGDAFPPDPGYELLEWFGGYWAFHSSVKSEQTAQAALLFDADTRQSVFKALGDAEFNPYLQSLHARLRGLLLEDQGRFAEALDAFEEIPSAADQVRVLWRTGQIKEAAALFKSLGEMRVEAARQAILPMVAAAPSGQTAEFRDFLARDLDADETARLFSGTRLPKDRASDPLCRLEFHMLRGDQSECENLLRTHGGDPEFLVRYLVLALRHKYAGKPWFENAATLLESPDATPEHRFLVIEAIGERLDDFSQPHPFLPVLLDRWFMAHPAEVPVFAARLARKGRYAIARNLGPLGLALTERHLEAHPDDRAVRLAVLVARQHFGGTLEQFAGILDQLLPPDTEPPPGIEHANENKFLYHSGHVIRRTAPAPASWNLDALALDFSADSLPLPVREQWFARWKNARPDRPPSESAHMASWLKLNRIFWQEWDRIDWKHDGPWDHRTGALEAIRIRRVSPVLFSTLAKLAESLPVLCRAAPMPCRSSLAIDGVWILGEHRMDAAAAKLAAEFGVPGPETLPLEVNRPKWARHDGLGLDAFWALALKSLLAASPFREPISIDDLRILSENRSPVPLFGYQPVLSIRASLRTNLVRPWFIGARPRQQLFLSRGDPKDFESWFARLDPKRRRGRVDCALIAGRLALLAPTDSKRIAEFRKLLRQWARQGDTDAAMIELGCAALLDKAPMSRWGPMADAIRKSTTSGVSRLCLAALPRQSVRRGAISLVRELAPLKQFDEFWWPHDGHVVSDKELPFVLAAYRAKVHLGLKRVEKIDAAAQNHKTPAPYLATVAKARKFLEQSGVPKADMDRAAAPALPKSSAPSPQLLAEESIPQGPLDDQQIRILCRGPRRTPKDLWELVPKAPAASALRLELACAALSGHLAEPARQNPDDVSPKPFHPKRARQTTRDAMRALYALPPSAFTPKQWREIARMLASQPRWRLRAEHNPLPVIAALAAAGESSPAEYRRLAGLPDKEFSRLIAVNWEFFICLPRLNPAFRNLAIAMADEQTPGPESDRSLYLLGAVGPGPELETFRAAAARHLPFRNTPLDRQLDRQLARSLGQAGMAGDVVEIAGNAAAGKNDRETMNALAHAARGLWDAGCPKEAWRIFKPRLDDIMAIEGFSGVWPLRIVAPVARDAHDVPALRRLAENVGEYTAKTYQTWIDELENPNAPGKLLVRWFRTPDGARHAEWLFSRVRPENPRTQPNLPALQPGVDAVEMFVPAGSGKNRRLVAVARAGDRGAAVAPGGAFDSSSSYIILRIHQGDQVHTRNSRDMPAARFPVILSPRHSVPALPAIPGSVARRYRADAILATAAARPGTRPTLSVWIRGGTPITRLHMSWYDSEGRLIGIAYPDINQNPTPSNAWILYEFSTEKPLPKNTVRLEVSIKNPGWSGTILSGLTLLD